MSALQSPHAKSSKELVECSMMVIVNLTVFDAGNRAKLGDMGACPGAVWEIRDLLDGAHVVSSLALFWPSLLRHIFISVLFCLVGFLSYCDVFIRRSCIIAVPFDCCVTGRI